MKVIESGQTYFLQSVRRHESACPKNFISYMDSCSHNWITMADEEQENRRWKLVVDHSQGVPHAFWMMAQSKRVQASCRRMFMGIDSSNCQNNFAGLSKERGDDQLFRFHPVCNKPGTIGLVEDEAADVLKCDSVSFYIEALSTDRNSSGCENNYLSVSSDCKVDDAVFLAHKDKRHYAQHFVLIKAPVGR